MSRSRGRGSAKARRSSVSRSSGRTRSSTWAVRSRTAAVTGTGPRQAPPAGLRDRGEQPPFAHGGEQLAQQAQIAPAQPVQPACGEGVGGDSLGGREQVGGLVAGQRRQGEAGQQLPGPQPGHGARHGHALRGDDQEPGAAVHGELVHEGGGGVVEQVGVVDQQQAYAGQELYRPVQGDGPGQEVGEGGEGDVPGRGRPGRPGAVRAADRFGHEPGLAAAGRAGHHDAAASGGHRPSYQFQFVRPPGERPGRPQCSHVPLRSRHGNMSRPTRP